MAEMPEHVADAWAKAALLRTEYDAAAETIEPQRKAWWDAHTEAERIQKEAGHVWTVTYWRYHSKYTQTFLSEKSAISWCESSEDEGYCSVESVVRPDGSEISSDERWEARD